MRRTFAEALFDEAKYAYDRDGGAACLGALSAMPAACGPFADGLFGPGSDFERVCGRVFAPRGSAAPGEPCVAGFECAAPADLDALSSCALGTRPDGGYGRACEVIAYGGEGAPCDTGAAPRRDARPSVTRACKPGGLYCASDGACRARVAEAGLPCEPGACAGGTFCNGQSLCEAKRGVGAPCDDTASACDGAGFCDRATKLCQPRRAEGEPCAGEAECQGACAGGACSAPLPDRSDDYRVLCAHTATPGD